MLLLQICFLLCVLTIQYNTEVSLIRDSKGNFGLCFCFVSLFHKTDTSIFHFHCSLLYPFSVFSSLNGFLPPK